MPASVAGDGKADESDRHERDDEGQMCHLKGKSSDASSASSCRLRELDLVELIISPIDVAALPDVAIKIRE